ncbi:hypothetical protein TNCV_2048731 [Trichonephila clavipes]|nr:hypothetical protein TNCV_2048731 [Trichonephila clavipes]
MNENKIDGERQRASASAQNGWRKSDGNQKKETQKRKGRGNKRRQSQSGRDVVGAKHETGRNWPERRKGLHLVVQNCNSNYKEINSNFKVQMFGFPKEDFLRKKWIQAISGKDFVPSKYSKANFLILFNL